MADPGFNAGVDWSLWQSGRTNPITFAMRQSEAGFLSGKAYHDGADGDIEGRVDGLEIHFVIDWGVHMNHGRGRYTGRLGIDRLLSGQTYNLNDMSQQATWISTTHF